MTTSDVFRRNLPAIGAAVRSIIVFSTVLSIPLAAAQTLELSESQTSSWILALYGLPSALSLVLTYRYQLPIQYTGNLFVIIFISRLGDQLSYPELIGASVLAGAAVLLVSLLGLTARLADVIPMPVVFGLLAGAVMPFVADIFTLASDDPAMIGGAFLAYIGSRWLLGDRLPPILPALAAGLVLAAVTGAFGPVPTSVVLDGPEMIRPDFTFSAVATVTPVFVVLITLQANLPALLYLRSQDYRPPETLINRISGISSMVGSFLGPTGVSLSLPATSLVAGPEAGDHAIRHRSIYIAASAALLVGLLAPIAAALTEIIPLPLLLALAGLAVVDILANALHRVAQGPLKLGPLFAFAIGLSEISLFGFGPFFWALVIGTGVSALVERNALRTLHDQNGSGA